MKTHFSVLLTICLAIVFCVESSAQDKLLGTIDFPNSGDEAAQADFIEGVKFLHNFEYEDAARAFQRAQEKDPNFAMAYYGEAKTHNHPIWMQQNRDAAMEILDRLGETMGERQAKASTQREKDYLMTLEVLYGNTSESAGKSKEERDYLYKDAMEKLHEKYPDDHEAIAFYGLSILGTAHDGRDYAIYMKAAAELFGVWNENQEHPGAAHYLIHSFDDPVHAPLGLPMAKAYSKIAPAAAHAQHMTSHIFLALGIWEDVIDANIVARDVQQTRQKELGDQPTVCGHYTWWLQYGYLQQGKTEEARQVLRTCYDRIKKDPTSSEKWHFSVMRGHQIIESEVWPAAEEWTAEYETDNRAAINYLFTTALSAIKMGDRDKARRNLNKLMETPESKERNIQKDQILSLMMLEEGKAKEALQLLQETVEAESALPIDFGPPVIIKPSWELLGDVLMELENYSKAHEAYEKQLERTPKRAHSILGKDRAESLISD
jgi:tetratricopeptide (TPR) repeat protein